MRTIFGDIRGGFPVIAETIPSHVFTKVNHASTRSSYVDGNFYWENCLQMFPAITGKLV